LNVEPELMRPKPDTGTPCWSDWVAAAFPESGLLIRPVKDVEELGADLEGLRFRDAEHFADAHLLVGPAGIAVIAIVSGRCAPLTGPGITPGGWIEDEFLVRIDAAAIKILQEERLAGNTIGERAAEQQRIQVIVGVRDADGLSAGVAENSAQRPTRQRDAREGVLIP
jgi:hypothetical protein